MTKRWSKRRRYSLATRVAAPLAMMASFALGSLGLDRASLVLAVLAVGYALGCLAVAVENALENLGSSR